MTPLIPPIVGALPYNSQMALAGNDDETKNGTVSYDYQTYFSGLQQNLSQIVSRGTPGIFLNSDFNLLSANGTTPVTPAQGTNYEVVKQWFLMTGGGGNDYTITPTPQSTVNYYGTGSNNYLDVAISDLDTPLYLYNKNYSTTGQFNAVSLYSGSPLNFSFSIDNQGDSDEHIQFSAFLNGATFPDGSNEIFGEELPLKPGFNIAGKEIQIPELTGTAYDPSNYIQLRCYFKTHNSTGGAHLVINYLKSELSDTASLLDVNHILDSLLCNTIT